MRRGHFESGQNAQLGDFFGLVLLHGPRNLATSFFALLMTWSRPLRCSPRDSAPRYRTDSINT